MDPVAVLSMPKGKGVNYINALSANGFKISGDYLTADISGDALVLCGGGDIDPSYYGELPCGSMPPDVQRDKSEFYLFEKYYAAGKPIFGICRGMQLVNVALGGKLIQHLACAANHSGENDVVHAVTNFCGTPVEQLFGREMTVNSAHHQACSELGCGLCVMQAHRDGIYGKNILAVQWHPERMIGGFDNGVYAPPAALFELFREMVINK